MCHLQRSVCAATCLGYYASSHTTQLVVVHHNLPACCQMGNESGTLLETFLWHGKCNSAWCTNSNTCLCRRDASWATSMARCLRTALACWPVPSNKAYRWWGWLSTLAVVLPTLTPLQMPLLLPDRSVILLKVQGLVA